MVQMQHFASLFINNKRKEQGLSSYLVQSKHPLWEHPYVGFYQVETHVICDGNEFLVLLLYPVVGIAFSLLPYSRELDWNRHESPRVFLQAISRLVFFMSFLGNEPTKIWIFFSKNDIYPQDRFIFYFLMNI